MYLGENIGLAEYQIYKPIRALVFRFKEKENILMPAGASAVLHVDLVSRSTGAVQKIIGGVELLACIVLQDGINLSCSEAHDSTGQPIERDFTAVVHLADGAVDLGTDKYIRLKIDTTEKMHVSALEDGRLTKSMTLVKKIMKPVGMNEFTIDTRQGKKIMLMAGSGYMLVKSKERTFEVDLQTETYVRAMDQPANFSIQNMDITLTYSRYLNWAFGYPLKDVEEVTFFVKDSNDQLYDGFYLNYEQTIK